MEQEPLPSQQQPEEDCPAVASPPTKAPWHEPKLVFVEPKHHPRGTEARDRWLFWYLYAPSTPSQEPARVMALHIFHDLTLEVQQDRPDAGVELEWLLQNLSFFPRACPVRDSRLSGSPCTGRARLLGPPVQARKSFGRRDFVGSNVATTFT